MAARPSLGLLPGTRHPTSARLIRGVAIRRARKLWDREGLDGRRVEPAGDERTCEACSALVGKAFSIDGARVGRRCCYTRGPAAR
ncbi:MAG: hypothetical protein ACFNLW_12140 [Olsenella sp.]